MYSLDLSSMRHRDGGKLTNVEDVPGHNWTDIRNKPATNVMFKSQLQAIKEKDMWDVVIKDFHKRSKAGEIFNNPMQSIETAFNTTGQQVGVKTAIRSSNGSLVEKMSVNKPLRDSLGGVSARRTLFVDEERLRNIALTSAYAGVTANEQNAVLWFGEFRETVKMVTDIGKSLLALYQKTKKQRVAWAKGKLSVPEAQSLTLGLLYGILPLEQSIAQVMEGLFNLKANGRETSRGFQVVTDTKVTDKSVNATVPATSHSHAYNNKNVLKETIQVTVRAGVLYDIDVDEFPAVAIIADPKQIAETAYALARLSFVIDWFVNVGSTIMAWSPSVGTKELSAWVSVEETYTAEYFYSSTQVPVYASGLVYESTANYTFASDYKVTRKVRYPVNRSDLAIFPRLSVNLNFSKLNSLVLLFADAKKKR